jgi:thiol:disulfide interchange protein
MHLINYMLRPAVALTLFIVLLASQAFALVPPGTRWDAFAESEYAVVQSAEQDRDVVRQGDEFTLVLRVTPFKTPDDWPADQQYEYHLYGIEDSPNPNYVKPVFKMDDAPGITWTVEFPKGQPSNGGKNRDGSYAGDIYMLHGQQVILIRGKVAPDAPLGERDFSAYFMFNACTDEACLYPSEVKPSWQMTVVSATDATMPEVVPVDQLLVKTEVKPELWSIPTEAQLAADAEPAEASDDEAEEPAGGAVAIDEFTPQTQDKLPLGKALFLAFIGGLILNFMPCVLPVVSIKVISLARSAQSAPGVVVKQGLIFCAGIIATFLALALVVNLIQAGGTKLGWGFQFQNPIFLIVMSTIIFAFGLSLAGVYTIKAPSKLTEEAEELSEKEGYAGAFFKGVLATVLGTPCVGPFLGPALGYAFMQSAAAVWLIFLAVGLGMALPYALLVSNPRFLGMGQRERGQLTRKIMDAKGWLVDFERVMAFVLFATVLYLLNILGGSLGPQAITWSLVFLLAVAFALWLWGRMITYRRPAVTLAAFMLGVGMIAGVGAWALPRVQPPAAAAESSHLLAWEEFSNAALQQHIADGRTVLVDFTADWCPNCKTNEIVALNVPETKQVVEQLGVVTLIADWTHPSDEISKMLRSLGYSSIPLTAIFPASSPSAPILLDGLYSPSRIQQELRNATSAKLAENVQ